MNTPKTLTAGVLAIETIDTVARTQRRLPWAVTVIKDSETPNALCVEMLADTLSTIRQEMPLALAEHSGIKRTLLTKNDDIEKVLAAFIQKGIDHVTVTIDIQRQDTQSLGQFLRKLTSCFDSTWDIFVDAVSRPHTSWQNATKIRMSLAKTRISDGTNPK